MIPTCDDSDRPLLKAEFHLAGLLIGVLLAVYHLASAVYHLRRRGPE